MDITNYQRTGSEYLPTTVRRYGPRRFKPGKNWKLQNQELIRQENMRREKEKEQKRAEEISCEKADRAAEKRADRKFQIALSFLNFFLAFLAGNLVEYFARIVELLIRFFRVLV